MNNLTATPEYRQLFNKYLVVDSSYQRTLNADRVKRIVKEFNPNLVNPIKVSFRDGKYYVFDGQHTLAALRAKHSGNFMVLCAIYKGLSVADEAILFSQQNGISRQVESLAKFKSLFFAGDREIMKMVQLTEAVGFQMDFSKCKADNRIVAVAKAYKIFTSVSELDYVGILSAIKEAWNGASDSLNSEMLGGLHIFYKTYINDLDIKLLVKQLSKVAPIVIIREGKLSTASGDTKFARQVLNVYNKGLSAKRLPDRL